MGWKASELARKWMKKSAMNQKEQETSKGITFLFLLIHPVLLHSFP